MTALLVLPILATAQNEIQLAREIENPLAAVITIPLQHNWDFGIGAQNAMKYTVKLQPIIPFSLSTNWTILSRTILPFAYAEPSAPDRREHFGLEDTSLSLFLSPKRYGPQGVFWGVGPAFHLPTATDDALGNDQWGAGPTIALSKQSGGWTAYILSRHIWSFAGDDDPSSFSETLIQPSLAYTLETRTTIGVVAEAKYDWQGEQWTVPVNLAVSQLVKIGKAPIKFTLGGRVYFERPPDGPDWGLRFTTTFLLPD